MKILFITDLYPVCEDEKTTPRTLYNFVKVWQREGHSVEVLKPNFILNSFLRKKPFYKTGWYGNVFNVNYWLPFIGNIEHKIKGVDIREFDAVVAHMPSGILFADKLKIPFIAGIHNSDIEVLTNPLYKFHFKKRLLSALENSKGIACRSYVLKEKLLKLYPQFKDKVFVAPSGVDEEFITKEFSHCIDKHKLKIITCANFKKRKNIDKLIKACRGIDGIDLMVIGDGSNRKNLEKIDPNVNFKGCLPNEKVMEAMRGADLFILPSVGETFGMVYLEAMASGCITVCSENDGIDGIIENGVNGFTVKPEVDAIRDLILKIKNSDNEKLNQIRLNSLNTINKYTQTDCGKWYVDAIHKKLFQ